ncbi:MAG: tRNA 2-methylthio-N6-isopentenyl adenosine(37) hydroxylase MiaE [Bacteroidetes bacterium 47-18]|nr:MAG: tRNA 2-methylthio-N6-isopentenyl adenosine(37) hydroxylase MiaE [Bacteroidetes bacterium 47-18]
MSSSENTILGLKMATDPRWADVASLSLEHILTDHAFCEQKAATQCISLIQQFSDYPAIVEALAPIVTEEWGHFRMVLAEMKKRGFQLGSQRKDEYVNKLLEHTPKGGTRESRLLHKLLICALIEARSCERFRILYENLEDRELSKFYYKFMISEAGHYRLFLDLAREYFDHDLVRQEWLNWLQVEKNILADMPARSDRMH